MQLCRRHLLQSSSAIDIGTFIASDDPQATSQAYNSSVSDGQLKSDLAGIGLTLVGNPTVTVRL